MDLKIGTVLKAVLIILGLVVGSETLEVFSEERINQLAGALSILGSVVYDVIETIKLKRAGVTKADGR